MTSNDLRMVLELIGRAQLTGREALAVAQLQQRITQALQNASKEQENGDSARSAE